MKTIITAPSKTFLLGEYLCAKDGKALLVNTEPRFRLEIKGVKSGMRNRCSGIGVKSEKSTKQRFLIPDLTPSGKFIKDNWHHFKNCQIEFFDPHDKKGGFGASSAQFLTLYLSMLSKQANEIDEHELLNTYRKYHWDGDGMRPSGTDLIAQLKGNITLINWKEDHVTYLDWPFPTLDFFLIRTGSKIATHQHLKDIEHFEICDLDCIMDDVINSINKKDPAQFIHAIKEYHNALASKNFVYPKTAELLHNLCTNTFVLAAKGCGSLGADVILVICNKNERKKFQAYAAKNRYNIVAMTTDISHGVDIRFME